GKRRRRRGRARPKPIADGLVHRRFPPPRSIPSAMRPARATSTAPREKIEKVPKPLRYPGPRCRIGGGVDSPARERCRPDRGDAASRSPLSTKGVFDVHVPRAAGPGGRSRARLCPHLERLEGRVVLSTFRVNTTVDSVAVNLKTGRFTHPAASTPDPPATGSQAITGK